MIRRLLETTILTALKKTQKLILIYGPRQVGKTTLLHLIQERTEKDHLKILFLNCDIEEDLKAVNTTSLSTLKKLLTDYRVVFIDEAQRLDNPGLTLKIIHDNLSQVRIIATGSSSFELKNALSDALTGRYIDFTLHPLSFDEIGNYQEFSDNPVLRKQQAESLLPTLLLYGSYPEIYLAPTPTIKRQTLLRLVESYLFRDVLDFARVRFSRTIVNLARALAYQLGSEVSETELASRLKIDQKTIATYLDILEQSFVIIRVYPFSRNPRREIGRKYKVYFWDTGLRNALIDNFHNLEVRPDLGALWENFIINQRLKKSANINELFSYYFWRTYGGAEVDWLEQKQGKLFAYECKYSQNALSRGAREFTKIYHTSVELINTSNYLSYI